MGERVGRVGDLTSRLIDFFFFFQVILPAVFQPLHIWRATTPTPRVLKRQLSREGEQKGRGVFLQYFVLH